MNIEAMKKALEALEIAAEGGGVNFHAYAEELRQAIAEFEKQEPYGWVSQHTTKGLYEWQFNKELSGVYKDTAISILPVYTHPQPKREPLTNENPLLVFAKECVLGAYSEDELADAAFKAIESAHGIKGEA